MLSLFTMSSSLGLMSSVNAADYVNILNVRILCKKNTFIEQRGLYNKIVDIFKSRTLNSRSSLHSYVATCHIYTTSSR